MDRVSIIGTGNVGHHLVKAFHSSGFEVVQVYGRHYAKASNLAEEAGAIPVDALEKIDPTVELVVVAVSDGAVPEIAGHLSSKLQGLVVHTAGSVSIETLARFENFGVMYPLQTFTKSRALCYAGLPFFIEANSSANLQKLDTFARKISNSVTHLDSDNRRYIHLAAVTGANFMNHLLSISKAILSEKNISLENLKPLMYETLDKAFTIGPETAQTGPAVRKNLRMIDEHIKILKDISPDYAEVYNVISKSIINDYK